MSGLLPEYLHSGLPLGCSSPNVVAHPDLLAFPGMVGTGFFARLERRLFYFTALHCATGTSPSEVLELSALLVPYRLEGTHDKPDHYVQVDSAFTLEQYRGSELDDRLDLVVFPVLPAPTKRDNQHLLSRAAKLPASSDWLDKLMASPIGQEALAGNRTLRAVALGFPSRETANGIEYATRSAEAVITSQLVALAGSVRAGTVEHCLLLDDITWQYDPSGFSGSPVFAQFPSRSGPQYALLGMIICGSLGKLNFIHVGKLLEAANGGA